MSRNTATETHVFDFRKTIFSFDPDGGPLRGIQFQGKVFDPDDWDIEIRLTERLPPLPVGTLALVGGDVWRKADTLRWHPLAGLGFVLQPWTDRQIREKGKPLTAGEWSSV